MTTIQSRWASLAALSVVLVWLAAPVRTAQADVALLLAQAREAMGGDCQTSLRAAVRAHLKTALAPQVG